MEGVIFKILMGCFLTMERWTFTETCCLIDHKIMHVAKHFCEVSSLNEAQMPFLWQVFFRGFKIKCAVNHSETDR